MMRNMRAATEADTVVPGLRFEETWCVRGAMVTEKFTTVLSGAKFSAKSLTFLAMTLVVVCASAGTVCCRNSELPLT